MGDSVEPVHGIPYAISVILLVAVPVNVSALLGNYRPLSVWAIDAVTGIASWLTSHALGLADPALIALADDSPDRVVVFHSGFRGLVGAGCTCLDADGLPSAAFCLSVDAVFGGPRYFVPFYCYAAIGLFKALDGWRGYALKLLPSVNCNTL